ncbi:hypothetical protein EJ07DRAFT_172340 [Lizonia empirigonia]|nr:hypothetical protein EJ07DRAFT_172340 [Lizonia empirigonia]
MDFGSHPSAIQHDRINSWLASKHGTLSPLTPPPDDDSELRQGTSKRKRATSLPAIMPAGNAATVPNGEEPTSISMMMFNPSRARRNSEAVFHCPPASRVSSGLKRSSSPTRETPLILRSAWPPVLTESLNGLKEAPPEHVDRLGDWLAKGIDFGFIPQGLQHVIKNDPEVGHQTTKPGDFDRSDMRSAGEMSALWAEAKKIFLNARDCKDAGRDENAWCDDVVRPLVHLVIDLYGEDRWWLQNVQSQSINPLYLSTIPAPTMTDSTRRKPIDRKIDYIFSYSHRHSAISALYKKLDAASNREIGHTLDAFTKRTALFSGIEVKSASGDHTEAELQMSIGISASLHKKEELTQMAQIPIDPTTMVEPALTIVGHEHSVYYAYPREDLVKACLD